MTVKKTNTACLIFNDQKQLLLLQRDLNDESMAGLWELPSGGKEKGETVEECLLREVQEETGIKVNNFKFAEIEEYKFTNKKGITKEVTEHTFIAYLKETPQVQLSEDHTSYQWVELSQLDDFYSDKQDRIYKRIKRITDSKR